LKRLYFTLSILIICLTLFFLFGFQRLANRVITRLMSQINTGSIQLHFKNVNYSFPLSLKLSEVTLRNEEFLLTAPEVNILFNWNLLIGGEGTISASLPQAKIDSQSDNFLNNIKDFRLNHVPDFEVIIQNLLLPKNDFLSSPIPVRLQKKHNLLHFQVDHSEISLSGTIEPEKRAVVDYRILNKKYPAKGHFELLFQDNILNGTILSKVNLALSTKLSFHDREIELQQLQLKEVQDQDKMLTFSGKGRLQMEPKLALELMGVITNGKDRKPYQVNLEFQPTENDNIQGKMYIMAKNPDFELRSTFLIVPETSSFSLRLLSGSSFAGNPVNADINGTFGNGQIKLEFITPSLDISSSGVTGNGSLKGEMLYSSGTVTAEGQLSGEWLRFQQYELIKPLVTFQYDRKKGFLFQASGQIFGGDLKLAGQYTENVLTATGALFKSKIDQFLGEKIPLNGWFSGNIEIHKSKSDAPSLTMVINDGALYWKDMFLGNQLIGNLDYQGDKLSITDVMLQNQEGKVEGRIEKISDSIQGTFQLTRYPLSYSVADRSVHFTWDGQGGFHFAENKWRANLAITSPHWDFGEWSGTNFIFQGDISSDTIQIKKLDTQFLGGHLSFHGNISPYQAIDLNGHLNDVHLPNNSFQYQGRIHQISLSVKGDWDNVSFFINGEGEDLSFQGKSIGESFQVVLEGKTRLPQKNEKAGIETYLNPEILKKGTIHIRGANLAQFGLTGKGKYEIAGTADILADLDVTKKIWLIQTEKMTVSVGDVLHFSGHIQGIYQNDRIQFQELIFKDESKNIQVKGSGFYDLKNQIIEGLVSGQFDTSFPLPDYGIEISLSGSATLSINGSVEKPRYSGHIQINNAILFQQGEEVFQVKEMTGTVKDGALIITKGSGQWLGFDIQTEGSISPTDIHLTFLIDGENGLLGQLKTLQGLWQGKISLQGSIADLRAEGEIKVKNGFLDTTTLDKTQTSSAIFQSFAGSFQKIPIKMKLLLVADDTFRVKTRFLDLKLAGGLTIQNLDGSLGVEGRLDVVNGTYDLVMRTVPIQGYVIFGDFFEFMPKVHLEGHTKVNHYNIVLRADGPLDNYEMILQSEPPLSQEEILSLLFVGDKDAYTSLDSLDLEPHLLKALRFFLGMKGAGLNNFLFFDSVELITPSQKNEGFYGLELKKDLGENASISYTHDLNGGDNSTWNFEVDLNREWSFKSEFGSNGKFGWELEFTTKF